MLTDAPLLRYNRQILLHDFDIAGQERLQQSKVLVVGLGGLGCPAALYLAAAGVGELVLADGHVVELSNLQRQIAHTDADIGRNKARSAADAIAALNPEVSVRVVEQSLVESAMPALLAGVNVVIDATDNFPVRFALNRACIAAGVPLVSAAAVRSEGQLAVFDPTRGGPCYACLYTEGEAGMHADPRTDTALSCSESGVLAPLVGVLGSLQAMEALKILSGYGEPMRGRLLVIDLRTTEFRELRLPVRVNCPACAQVHR